LLEAGGEVASGSASNEIAIGIMPERQLDDAGSEAEAFQA